MAAYPTPERRPPGGYAPGMTVPRATRLVSVRQIHPYTVHELDCPKLDLTLTKRRPKHYLQVPISEVPASYPRCKICTPGTG